MISPKTRNFLVILIGSGVFVVIMIMIACDGDDGKDCGPGQVYCWQEPAGCYNLPNSAVHCGACGNSCGHEQRCQMSECVGYCAANQLDCDHDYYLADCVSHHTDRENCGSCGFVCEEDQTCRNRECVTCYPPNTRCMNACADLMNDLQHCGECNRPCTEAGTFCECGECVTESSGLPCPGADGDADVDSDVDADGDGDSDAEIEEDTDIAADSDE